MLIKAKGYSYNDVTIIPSDISDVKSRSECDPLVKTKENYDMLPIFTAPMASVVSEENYNIFHDYKIIPIIPRNIPIENRLKCMYKGLWVALSLNEFETFFIKESDNYLDKNTDKVPFRICVDIANGHMKSLYSACKSAKIIANFKGQTLYLMVGNIANPKTYKWICKNCSIENENNQLDCCIDYIRVGIGGGSGCITTSNVAVHNPQASLLDECKQMKSFIQNVKIYKNDIEYNRYTNIPKIIADGGIRNYSDVIKALALGADYVMIGSLFSQCIESAGVKSNKEVNQKIQLKFPIERYKDFEIDQKGNWWAYYTDEAIKNLSKAWEDDLNRIFNDENVDDAEWKTAKLKYNERIKGLREKKFIGHIDVKFFGMASADGQKSISGEKTKTSEGITKYLPVKYTLKGWVINMISYLRSAMSYTNYKTLEEFIGKPELIVNSISEINAVNK